jgi:hypothetical protein
MNRISTTSQRSFRLQAAAAAALVALIALTGATWLTITAPTEPTVVLDRVVVEGRRAEVQQLPRVVVTGKRDAAGSGTQVAAACMAPALC